MKLAFSSNAYLRFPVEEAISRIAQIGYEGLEILADVPHAWPAGLLEVQKASIRTKLAEHRLAVSNVNAFMMNAVADARHKYWHPSWIEPERWYRRVRVDHTIRALNLAKELGAPHITTEPGGPLANMTRRHGMDLFVEELRPAVEHAERIGVKLLVEPEPELLIENADQYLELADRLPSPALGLNFDIGHFYCVGEDPAAAVQKLKPHIRHVHVEDIAATRVHEHLIPGHGAINFAAVFRALREIGYDGWLTVELYAHVNDPDAAARESLTKVRDILAHL